jgi:hypothetical protein
MSAHQPIQINIGTTPTVVFNIKTEDRVTAKDLTDYAVVAFVSDKAGARLLTKPLRVPNPTNGVAFWDWTAAETRLLENQSLPIGVEIECQKTGEEVRVYRGTIIPSGGANNDL